MKKLLYILLAMVVLTFGVGFSYANDYYKPLDYALTAMEDSDNVQVETEGKTTAYIPQNAQTGIIFYQGGKVAKDAYAPLLKGLSENGILCVEPQMPCNLAVLGINKADGIIEKYPDVKKWYIMGHSLGGSMAGAYLAKHTEKFDGIILLASYITSDLSQTDLKALSVYGTEDGVLAMDKYAENLNNLPNLSEYVIEGGNHAYFGCYGRQDGDGARLITDAEQTEKTVEILTNWLSQNQA